MRTYVLKRTAQAVLVLWAAYTLAFILLSALPGDSVNNRINDPESNLTPEAARTLLEYYGLDQPLWQQYLGSLGRLLAGDLGYSISTGKPVDALIRDALPHTLRLTGAGLVCGVVLAVTVAVAINYAPWRWVRNLAESVPALFGSVPTFVVGVVALQYFSFRLGLIPSVDDGSWSALVAPALTLGIVVAAPLAQVLATSIRHTRQQPFVHVMQAKGASEGYVFGKDVLRNSSLPVLTLLGLTVGELIAGSVVTEAVFARAGIGQVTVGAVNSQDLPVVQGVVLLSTLAYVVVNLVVDLAYPFVDPRVLVDTGPERARRLRRAGVGRAASAEVGDTTRPRLPVEVFMP